MCNNFGSSKPWMTGNSAPPNLIGIPRGNSIRSLSAWPFMRSKNCRSLFFQEDTSEKFLILLLSYLPVFWLQISSVFAIISADCHGLSCVHVRASSYTALFRVSLHAIGLRVSRFGSKDICTLQHGFLCFLLFLHLDFHSLACIITHLCFFIPSARSLRFGSRPWKVNIDQNWNPFLSLFVSENPRHLWLYFSRKCVFICYLFPLEHETRSW